MSREQKKLCSKHLLSEFQESLNIVTDSQYAERVVLHIETAELIQDDSELNLLFTQLQQMIRNSSHPLYITHKIPYRSSRPSSIW